MPDYVWRPIEPLSDAERAVDFEETPGLYEAWWEYRRQAQHAATLDAYNRRLIRRLSIETGILERLYDLDRGTTEALVALGFAEELISRSSTNLDPGLLIDVLRDQEAATQIVGDCVAKRRELTKGLVHELHATLTRHQGSTSAVDQFGTRLQIPLLKGRYKEQPNNPRRLDGTVHQYAPPVHVDAEMEHLLEWASTYSGEDPVLVAAWLHHRFTQIHPYQDGNGRVARAVTTLILVRADLLPVVIDRDLRTEYIDALESADFGDLTPLARLFTKLERDAILQALSLDDAPEVAQRELLTTEAIQILVEKLARRQESQRTELRRVNDVARALREHARMVLEESFDQMRKALEGVHTMESLVEVGGTDHQNGQSFKDYVIQATSQAGRFPNYSEDYYSVMATIGSDQEKLVFVVSFHHVGRELTGVMEAIAFGAMESRPGSRENLLVYSLEPFVFTDRASAEDIQDAFQVWLDRAVASAVKRYGERF